MFTFMEKLNFKHHKIGKTHTFPISVDLRGPNGTQSIYLKKKSNIFALVSVSMRELCQLLLVHVGILRFKKVTQNI